MGIEQRTAVIVDDDPDLLLITGLVFRNFGFAVHEADNPVEALRKAQALANIDVFLTDNCMPNPRDGIKLLIQVVQLPSAAKMKACIMSGTFDDLTSEDYKLIKENNWATLAKPFMVNDLKRLAV